MSVHAHGLRFAGRRLPLAIVVLALVAPAAFAAQAQAATYTVGTTSDLTGVCQSPAAGTCSLRQLINYENGISTPASPDTISVPAGSYSITNGVMPITQSFSLVGAGARTTTVAGNSKDQVFYVKPPAGGGAPTVSISGLTITGGNADFTNCFGGDIRNDKGTVTLSEDEITGGQACSGGGIGDVGGNMTVTHSLVTGNRANSGGADSGGIQVYGDTNVGAATLAVDNSTISDNTSNLGGGIFSWCDNGGANGGACSSTGAVNQISIENSTIAYNDGGTRGGTAGGVLTGTMTSGAPEGSISVQNSIIAFNTITSGKTQSNCRGGGISSRGYNIESRADCGFTSTGDHQNADPKFTSASPQNNGGNTNTLGLSAGSPAVDAIPYNDGAPCDRNTDQRDLPRPQGIGCDIGAFELVPTITATEGGAPFSGQMAPTQCGITRLQIDWGDGNSSPGSNATGQASHAYSEDGTYSGSVEWSDDCGIFHTSSFTAQVADASLTNPSGTSFNANAGQSFSGQLANFSDSDPNGTASDYTATINWGDGTSSLGRVTGSGPFAVNGSHTYATGGSFPVTASITDAGGSTTTATGSATVTPQSQPALTPGAPSVISTTSADFATTVDPDGLVTNVVFEYGPALAGARDVSHALALATSPTYTSTTPAQAIGPDYSNHTVTATVTGLLPNTTYHVRAVASNSAGTTTGPDQTVITPADHPPPAPTLGKTFNVAPVSGIVLIKINNTFVPLTEVHQVPSNAEIDALHGTVQLVTASLGAHAASPKRQKTQSGKFGGAIFKVTQARSGASKGQATLALVEGAFRGAPTYAGCKSKKASDVSSPFAIAASLSKSVLQTLHASAHGKFRTRGRFAAATVRGTKWTTSDRCDGTLVSVQLHTVTVTDFVRHVTLLVHQGHSYLAKARP